MSPDAIFVKFAPSSLLSKLQESWSSRLFLSTMEVPRKGVTHWILSQIPVYSLSISAVPHNQRVVHWCIGGGVERYINDYGLLWLSLSYQKDSIRGLGNQATPTTTAPGQYVAMPFFSDGKNFHVIYDLPRSHARMKTSRRSSCPTKISPNQKSLPVSHRAQHLLLRLTKQQLTTALLQLLQGTMAPPLGGCEGLYFDCNSDSFPSWKSPVGTALVLRYMATCLKEMKAGGGRDEGRWKVEEEAS
ncbi:hypothetical protein DFH07DRAFT_999217 [Mycena maculata]|uniref:Uncharacterized protein n=1 Tax=Mycena maculata TaxID=230809 RepID=A0AAD7HT94_9AGAR|nr:hypothetical protein DFH07DRAFT_999217 [Mycena maculata]